MARILILFVCIYFLTICSAQKTPVQKNVPETVTKPTEIRNRAVREGEEAQEHVPTTPEPELESSHCVCSKIYDPVCADNGNSYYNLCHMECDLSANQTLSVVHQGNCIPF